MSKWYALYTKPRWEKKVAEALERKGIECYCPLVTEVREWSDRKKKVTSPLFRSYVFVKLPDEERPRVFEVPGTVRYLFWLGQPALIRQEEMDVLKEWLESSNAEDISVPHLKPGDEVTISNGKLKDQEGIIAEVGRRRVKIVLKNLGLTVSIRVQEKGV